MLRSRTFMRLLSNSNNCNLVKPMPALLQSAHTRIAYRCYSASAEAASCVDTQPRCYISKAPEKPNIFTRTLQSFGLLPSDRLKMRIASVRMYESITDNIKYQAFFDTFSLPNTLNSWFLVTELHVWLLMRRAMVMGREKGEDGRFMRLCIAETLWSDVNDRVKRLGAVRPSVARKQVNVLMTQFQAALINYDEGFLSDDIVLASAIWRRFFDMNTDDYEKIELMAVYIRHQAAMLDSFTRDEFISTTAIPWIDLHTIAQELKESINAYNGN